jgi:hypothetical protein
MTMPRIRAGSWLVAATLMVGCGGGALAPGGDGGREQHAPGGDATATDGPRLEAPPADIGGDAGVMPPADGGADALALDATDVAGDAKIATDANNATDAAPDASRTDVFGGDVGPLDGSTDAGSSPTYLGTFAVSTKGETTAVAIASDGAIYFAGSFQRLTDFDPGPAQDLRTPKGQEDVFITKLEADGTYAWTLTFGGAGSQTFTRALAVSDTALVVAGGYTDAVDFDPGPGVQTRPAGAVDQYAGFVLDLTRDGAFVWASPLQGTSGCVPGGVALDADGSVYAAGGYDSICDFDPGPGEDQRTAASGQENGYLLKLAAGDGHALWAKTYSGDGCAGYLTSVTTTSDGLVWTTGAIGPTCLFDGRPTPLSTADTSAAIVSFSPDGTSTGLWSIPGGTGNALASTADGSLYVGGFVGGVTSTDFDPGPGVVSRTLPSGDGDPTGFILKLGAGAAFRWVQTVARVGTTSLAATGDGGVIALGAPVPDLQQTTAFTLTKLDADQTLRWKLDFAGTGAAADSVAAGPTTVIVSGNVYQTMDLDPGPGVDPVAANSSFLARFSF